MDAIVTAGGIPETDAPLYEFTQGGSKAMLDICGKPMIQWVLDALCQAEMIEKIVVVGLTEESGLSCPKLASYIPNQASMLENVREGVLEVQRVNPASKHVLLVSSDIPGITAEMVNWVVNTALETDDDVYYNVIPRAVMEARYPGSKRSFTRLKDVEVCGGDMNVVRTMTATGNDEFWERLIAARKNVFKQAAILGYDTLFLLLFRLITLDAAVKKVSKRIHMKGRAIVCPYAEVGMDVDKPFQLEIMRQDLSSRPAV